MTGFVGNNSLNQQGSRISDARSTSAARSRLATIRGESSTIHNPLILIQESGADNSVSRTTSALAHIEIFTKKDFAILTEQEIVSVRIIFRGICKLFGIPGETLSDWRAFQFGNHHRLSFQCEGRDSKEIQNKSTVEWRWHQWQYVLVHSSRKENFIWDYKRLCQ